MFKLLACLSTFITAAIAEPTKAQEPAARTQAISPRVITIPGTGYDLSLGSVDLRQSDSSSAQGLLIAIERWISIQFDLPDIHSHPRIILAPPAEISASRFKSLLSDKRTQAQAGGNDTVAIYRDATQTIYLPESWTARTPAQLSVLVHEMVHHFQNVLGLKHDCPQEREWLAYAAQDRWLGLFGQNLADEFELDSFSLFVKTRCFY